jgi:S-DNA-T family DNA segregation ATPase FtsK/SpoIIIE
MRTSIKAPPTPTFWDRLRASRWLDPSDGYSQELIFLTVLLSSAFTWMALGSFSPFDPSPYNYSFPPRTPNNLGGWVGSQLAGSLIYQLGALAILIPIPPLAMSFNYLRGQSGAFGRGRIVGWFLAFSSLLLAVQQSVDGLSIDNFVYSSGGTVGYYLHAIIVETFGVGGLYLFLGAGSLFALLLIRRQAILKPFFLRLRDRWPTKRSSEQSAALDEPSASPLGSPLQAQTPIVAQPSVVEEAVLELSTFPLGPDLDSLAIEPAPTPSHPLEDIPELSPERSDPAYQPPSVHLFKINQQPLQMTDEQKREFEQTAEALVRSFAEFGIGGEVIAIQPGPVVTVYEFQPHAGTKLAKVTGLLDDIALALKVDSIFIHPVSGKRALGVQVPNKKRETVFLGDLVQTSAFRDAKSPLTFALGKALNGDPICCDLASMPHLLTAGQTGSGKSVAVNALLSSLILKASPDQVRMILVDPKILELKVYEGIPHLLMPVITEPLKASLALKWACQEMDRRYQLMETAMVRHISSFNQYWEQASTTTREQLKDRFGDAGKLPYIVIVIDELADLMLTASKDVESSIQRLAQKARASGIHLVLATQRPSVDVITGVIKANLPCRIAFKVFSRIDSRTILDTMGAERLLGKGDMLFLRPGATKLERIQGAFLSDEEVVAMVDQLKKSSPIHYDAAAMEWIDEEFQRQSGSQADLMVDAPGSNDPKWHEALAIAQRQGAISASYLQRMLKIGYNRAARIVEAMETQGLVARADGSKPRAWIGPPS